MWQRAESRGQVSKTDGKQRAQTNPTSYTRCLRQKEGKTPHDHTRHMACGRSMGKQSGDEKGPATLQADSTHRSCNDLLYFSNAEIFTQLFVDHWGESVEDKKKVKKKHKWDHVSNMALSPMTLSQPQCSAMHRLATFFHVNKHQNATANMS